MENYPILICHFRQNLIKFVVVKTQETNWCGDPWEAVSGKNIHIFEAMSLAHFVGAALAF